jgi:hypothetical protein
MLCIEQEPRLQSTSEQEPVMTLSLVIILNVVLVAFVFVGIVALHAWAIRTSPSDVPARQRTVRVPRQRAARAAGSGSYARANA